MPGNGKKPCGSLPHSRNAVFQSIPEMIRPPPAAPSQPPEPHKNYGLRARKQPALAAPAGRKGSRPFRMYFCKEETAVSSGFSSDQAESAGLAALSQGFRTLTWRKTRRKCFSGNLETHPNTQFLCRRPRTRRSRRETTLLTPHPARKTVVCTNQGFLSKNSVPRPPTGRRAFGRSLFIVTVFSPSVKCRRRVSCTESASPLASKPSCWYNVA